MATEGKTTFGYYIGDLIDAELKRRKITKPISQELLRTLIHYTGCYGDEWPTSGAVEVEKEAKQFLSNDLTS